MRLVLGCAALLAVAGQAVAPAAAARTLTVAALEDYAPFSDSSLPDYGFSNALTREVLERAGYEVEIRAMSWSRALEMTRQGRFDVLPSIWYRPERKEDFAYTDAIAVNEVIFVKRAGDPFEYTGLDDLSGKRVGLVRGYYYDDDFMQAEGFYREDSAYNIATNLDKLHSGRIDLTLGDRLTVRYILNTERPEIEGDLAFTEGALSKEPLHVVVSRAVEDYEGIVADFNTALAEVRADGTYDDLLARYDMK